jgi:2'-5' RNA ligase
VSQLDLFGNAPASAPPPGQSAPPHAFFFALRPSAADAARIDAFSEKLLAEYGVRGKRLAPERLHISLDEVNASMVEAACLAADTVCLPAIEVCFDAAMTFSAGAVVLAGAKGAAGLNGVRQLRTTLGCAMADRGFKLRRSYEPHMTLAYDSRNQLAPMTIEPIAFPLTEFALVKSHVGRTRHEIIRTWTLKG